MTKDVSTFKKGTDCLTFHEHLFGLFLEELDTKNVNLVETIEHDIKLTVQITVVKNESLNRSKAK